jgi:Fic family protein
MKEQVYNFEIKLNWRLLRAISLIDRFDASWSAIEKKEGQSLKQLKSIATIKSVGASTRIEGSKMSDEEVEALLNNIDISKIEDRDAQEVVGYFNVLDLITESFSEINITESNTKNLHNQLLKHSEKDGWHRGGYKQHVNEVEATFPDGSKQIIFQTTEPGFPTDDAMRQLIKWHSKEKEVHQLVKTAAFVYEFLSIHPFQDGNGRLSRLLTTLLLLKSGYNWIQYVSLEHEIEYQKKDYYKSLRSCQAQRPNEDITEWIDFFLNALINVQHKLAKKLEVAGIDSTLSPREKSIYTFIENYPGCKSGEIAQKLGIASSTAKRILTDLVSKNLIEKYGKGAGTSYTVK